MFTILKSIGVYALGVLGFFVFWHWFFDKPNQHEILIPLLTGFGASALCCGIIEDEKISDKNEEFAHYVIVGVVTAGFWVYQFLDTYDDFKTITKNDAILSGIATVMHSWSDLLMAAVTFFCIVLCNVPPNFSFDKLKGNVSDIMDSTPTAEEPQPDLIELMRDSDRKDIQEATAAIELNPNDAMAYHKRGCAHNGLKQYEQAIQDFDKAIGLNPNFPETYWWRGISYSSLKQYERAIQDFDKAIELNPSDATAYSSRGNAYSELGKYALAILDYDKAIQFDSNGPFQYEYRGHAYFKLGKYKQAIQDFTKAIELADDLFKDELYYGRGLCYQALNDDLNAQADFEKAKALGHDS